MHFEKRLQGGHPNSLGNTVEVVSEVLASPALFQELFTCYFSNDEVVRLRVSNAMKRIAKEKPSILIPYLNRFLTEIALIDQASTKWTLAQLFLTYQNNLSPSQKTQAIEIMKTNVTQEKDWIVLSQTMNTLGKWAVNDSQLKTWLIPILQKHATDSRKSVSGRAKKVLATL